MITKQTKIFISIILLVTMSLSGLTIYNEYKTKIKNQIEAYDVATDWKNNYTILSKYQDDPWMNNFIDIRKVKDLNHLVTTINFESYGLHVNMDNLYISKADPIRNKEGLYMGIYKVCLTQNTQQDNTFKVYANNYPELINGLDKLNHRNDISMLMINVKKEQQIYANISDFCIYVRN